MVSKNRSGPGMQSAGAEKRVSLADLPEVATAHMLVCGVCGRLGKYRLGTVAVSWDRYRECVRAQEEAGIKGPPSPARWRDPQRRTAERRANDPTPTLFSLRIAPFDDAELPETSGLPDTFGDEQAALRPGDSAIAAGAGEAPAARAADGAMHDPLMVSPLEYATAFSRYFRCKHCDAIGPWRMPSFTAVRFHLMLRFHEVEGQENGVRWAEARLFDGTWTPCPAWGEWYFRQRLESEPHNAELWFRLGNTLKNGGRADLARAAFQEALGLDPLHLDAHVCLADAFEMCRSPRKAYEQWKAALRAAQQAVHLPRETRAEAVEVALQHALELARDPDDVFALMPQSPPALSRADSADPNEPIVVHMTSLNLRLRSDRRRIIAAFLNEPPFSIEEMRQRERLAGLRRDARALPERSDIGARLRDRMAASPTEEPGEEEEAFAPPQRGPRVGRNAPCPCGSGRKYKRCCGGG